MSQPEAPLDTIFERATRGDHTVLVGYRPITPPPRAPVAVVRVGCARHRQPLGPLLAVQEQVMQLVEETRRPLFVPGLGDAPSLRHRILAERPDGEGEMLIALLARLQRQLDVPLLLAFEQADHLDPASAQLLAVLLERGELRVPLLLEVGERPPSGPLASLIDAVAAKDETAVITAEAAAPREEPAADLDLDALLTDQSDELSVNVVRVLRAGATIGVTFEAEYVGALLGLDPLSVLELTQLAIDRGVPLRDLGEGVFSLPPALADRLRDTVTPSLAAAWHRQLAYAMGAEDDEAPEELDEAIFEVDDAAERLGEALGAEVERAETPLPVPEARDEARKRSRMADRAARHAEAAGDFDVAAGSYFEAARQAASLGAYGRAHQLLRRVLDRLEPAGGERARLLRIQALTEIGRIRWRAGGRDEAFTLDGALLALDEAMGLLHPSDPIELRAELPTLIAHVCYEMGESEHLDRALVSLGEAQRALREAGRTMDAARLLNDEAAVRVRLGQFDRAAELLLESRNVFKRFAGRSAVATIELAETDHLVARLMLRNPEDGARDEEAVGFAIACAEAAERRYAELGEVRECARVWETLGRLERLRGGAKAAMDHFRAAVSQQRRLGDLVGLARTTQALAQALAQDGLPSEALQVLADSIALNRTKGSRQGLAYNREAFDDIVRDLPPGDRRDLGELIEAVQERLGPRA